MGKGDEFLRLETEWKPCPWPDFCNVKTISERASMLGNLRKMCKKHSGGDWAMNMLFCMLLRNGQMMAVFCTPYFISQIKVPKNSTVFLFVMKFWSKLILE